MTDWIADTLYSNGVMKNKYHIHNQEELEQREFLLSSRNAIIFLQQQPKITNIRDLKKIHKIMFGQLYDWAGKYRPGNFQKNGYEFFDHTRFGFAENNINGIMAQQPKSTPLHATDYAELLDSINFMHPFREGNGRSCKVFLLAYAANHQQTIDYPRKNEEMIAAQNEANIEKIAKLIKIEDTPTREAAFKQLIMQRQAEQQEETRRYGIRIGR
ncbi:Fic family protein [Lactobacillus sp. ESL0791]|uniref:Fic/DOC family protein n=1 Tax=Lactobacillus sp. ESL0791 TaxID=2983234 RepID=UPI0023F91532|nr:Fic family protein [Lactobacillus sp. ESL0791]MDF7639771.1 Fic family protein [Lactobacillus sp. ESL0791]